MAALLRYGGRRSQATRLLSPFCPGSISRFCASDGSAGRGRGRGSDDLVPNPFEPPAPGSAPSSVSQGSGRGKKSSFAERLGVNFEPPPPKVDPTPDAPEMPKEEPKKEPKKRDSERAQSQNRRKPVDDRQTPKQKITHLGRQPMDNSNNLSTGDDASSVKTSPPPKGKLDESPSVHHGAPKVSSPVRTAVSPKPHIEDHTATKSKSRPKTTTTPKSQPSEPKAQDAKVIPKVKSKQGQSTSVKPTPKIAVKAVGGDDWMSELSPRKKAKEDKKTESKDDWLNELSPRSKKKAAPVDWSNELSPKTAPGGDATRPKDSIEDTAVLLSEDTVREDTATILPSGEPDISIDSSKSLDISVQEASASISESTHEIPAADSDPETPPTPSGIGDHTLAIKAKSENEMFTSDLITAEDDVTVTASAAEEPQNEEIELTESTLEPDQDMSYQTSVFEKFLSGTEDEAVFATGPTKPLDIEESTASQGDQKVESVGKGLEALLQFQEDATGRDGVGPREPEGPPSFSQPPPTQTPATPSPQEQSTASEDFGGSLMDRLGWGSDETFAGSEGPSAPQGHGQPGVLSKGSPGAPSQVNPLKSKLAERLGWTGDSDEFDMDDRSRGRRRAPRRRPTTDSPYQQRPRAAKLTPEDKRSRAFRSAKAMEMALEGRLDEFDPDSVELPEDNIDDEAEDRRFGRERQERPSTSGIGLEIREDEIPVPEWEGAPHKWDEYHVRDSFTQMGENPTQNEVMDVERIASLEMDPNYMVTFGPPVPWSQLDHNMTPRRFLMKNKDDIMEALKLTGADITNDDFMRTAHVGLHEFKMWKRWMDSGKKFKGESLHGNVKLEEKFMHHLVDSEISESHPMYSHLKQSIKALEHNAFWSFGKKAQYVQKMVHNALKDQV